jgi:anti-sigma regulatory factor (Ser/Thr protein kinase)
VSEERSWPQPSTVERRTAPLLARDFDLGSLVALRHEVARQCELAGLSGLALHWYVIAINEITTNAVRHGGGAGRLLLWCDPGLLHCRVADEGPGIPVERQRPDDRPPPDTLGGRGLWLARQGCQTLTLDTGPRGTTVTLSQPFVEEQDVR